MSIQSNTHIQTLNTMIASAQKVCDVEIPTASDKKSALEIRNLILGSEAFKACKNLSSKTFPCARFNSTEKSAARAVGEAEKTIAELNQKYSIGGSNLATMAKVAAAAVVIGIIGIYIC